MIYFDNAATSFPKADGLENVMSKTIEKYAANPGRSGHKLSMEVAHLIYEARKNISSFFNIDDPSHLIFTKNTTEALNMALFGILRKGDHVVTTSMEHNSVIRPLEQLTFSGIEYSVAMGNKKGVVAPEKIESLIQENTKLICVTGASNVTGTIMDIAKIGRIAKRHEIPLMVDGAQLVGHRKIDVKQMNISILAFPGHKGLLGPMGSGGLYVKQGIQMQPLLYGGTGTASNDVRQPHDYPEGFEAGTLNSSAIIGMNHSCNFVKRLGISNISKHEADLIKYFDEELDNMEFVKRYGVDFDGKTGVTAMNIQGHDCEEVASILSRDFGIAVRGGYHCSGLAHNTIGTKSIGAVRFSVGPYNDLKEIKYAINSIYKICKKY